MAFNMSLTSQPLQIRNILATILMPLLGIYLAFTTPLRKNTLSLAMTYYFLTGIGITAGMIVLSYHRLWSHRSYKAGIFLQAYLSIAGAASFQGSIQEWCRDHRAHHRFVDSEQDPYSISKGFWYAHMGWLIFKRKVRPSEAEVPDLSANKIVAWQHKNFAYIALAAGLGLPTLVAGLFWNDWKGGFVYAGILRIFFFQQSTFCVNSLAHWLGDQPYDNKNSPRDHLLTALVTFGEGYHNFHHEFPFDYRNGVKWYQYDPSKWSIWVWEKIGLASALGRFPQNVIRKGEYQQQKKKLEKFRLELDWGTPVTQLTSMTWEEFRCAISRSRQLICINGSIYDVEPFISVHPGGKSIISSYVGKDATAVFNSGIHVHTNAAHNLLDDFRSGILLGSEKSRSDEDEEIKSKVL